MPARPSSADRRRKRPAPPSSPEPPSFELPPQLQAEVDAAQASRGGNNPAGSAGNLAMQLLVPAVIWLLGTGLIGGVIFGIRMIRDAQVEHFTDPLRIASPFIIGGVVMAAVVARMVWRVFHPGADRVARRIRR
jgi:hypothetical protein